MRVEIRNALKTTPIHKAIAMAQKFVPELIEEARRRPTTNWEAPAFDPSKAFLLLTFSDASNYVAVEIAMRGERHDITSPYARSYKTIFTYGYRKSIRI